MRLYRITNTNTGHHMDIHASTRRIALNRVLDSESLYSPSDNANETLLTLCIADLGNVIKMHVLAVDMTKSHVCNRDGCDSIMEHSFMVKQAEMNQFMATNPRALTGSQMKKVYHLAWQARMRLDDAIRRDTDVMNKSYDDLKVAAAIQLGLRRS